MRYLMLIYSDEAKDPKPGTTEFDKFLNDYNEFTAEVKEKSKHLAGEALQGISTATTVRVRGEKTTATDGPFAETKEQLGGFYLLDCENLDEAIEYAAKIPSAKLGSIEIRPLMEFG